MRTVKRALDLELELIYASSKGGTNIDRGHATFEGTLGIDVITIDVPYNTWVELGKPNVLTALLRAE